MKAKINVKGQEIEGQIVEERFGKIKVEYQQGQTKKSSWFENKEIKRTWN